MFSKIKKLFRQEQPVKRDETPKITNWVLLKQKEEQEKVYEPITFATQRLNGDAKDRGIDKAKRLYKNHKVQVQNQWVNAYQSINTGYGTAQLTGYNYQTVNFWECYALAQDPLFTNIFNILSENVFSKGGKIDDIDDEKQKELNKLAVKYNLLPIIKNALRSSLVAGGCLLYLDFDNTDPVFLEEELDLATADYSQFKGFRHVDPINCSAVEVNTIDPTKDDYMQPSKWYIVGLGVVHASHFIKFEENMPELVMKPLCMYFGMPLTQLIKQDVANSNLITQGVANIVNKARMTFLKSSEINYITGATAQNFRDRLEAVSYLADNFSINPIKPDEEVQQFTYSLTGLYDLAKFAYQVVGAKTSIPTTVLFGSSAEGLNATGEGDRTNFYDKIRTLQFNITPQFTKMYTIVNATQNGYQEFTGYTFNNLEVPNSREKMENIKSLVETGKNLIEMGADSESVLNWLKSNKDLGLQNVEIDSHTDDLEEYDDTTDGIESQKVANAWDENKHPRDKDGKFGNGSGQKSSIEKSTKSKEEKIKEIPESYRKVYEKAVESEPEITDMIKTVCKASGGKPAGLDFRLKNVESYMRKVKADSEEGKNEEDVANNLYDVVRYTNELSTKEFKKGVDIAIKELHNKGCKLVQLKNFYLHKNNPYRGINCKFESPDGQKFELQFNTPHNLNIKEYRLHPVYETWRKERNPYRKEYQKKRMSKITKLFDDIFEVDSIKEYPPEK